MHGIGHRREDREEMAWTDAYQRRLERGRCCEQSRLDPTAMFLYALVGKLPKSFELFVNPDRCSEGSVPCAHLDSE